MAASDAPIPESKLQIERMSLKLRRVQLSEEATEKVGNLMQQEGRLYFPVTDYAVQTFLFQKGTKFRSTPNSIMPNMPRRVFVLFVDSDSFAGSIVKNPMHYQHSTLKKISLNLNGGVYSMEHMDFEESFGVIPYSGLVQACSVSNRPFAIDGNDFEGEYTIHNTTAYS